MKGKVLDMLIDLRLREKKGIGILMDPDKTPLIPEVNLKMLRECSPDLILVGGSYFLNPVDMDTYIIRIKEHVDVPVVIFPGSFLQISKFADAILFLWLVGARSSEYTWGYHYIVAPLLKQWKIEVISTAYIPVKREGSLPLEYLAQYIPIPHEKPYLIEGAVIASEFLGANVIYLEAGSGSYIPLDSEIMKRAVASTQLPVIYGGGIKTPLQLEETYKSGVHLSIVGSALEENFSLLPKFIDVRNRWS